MFKSIARTHEAALFIVTTAFRKPRPFSHIFDFTLLDRTPRSLSDASLNLVSWSVEQNTFLHGHRRQLSEVPVNNNVLLLIHCDSIDSLHFYTHVAIHKNAKNTKFAKLCNSLCCVNWNGEYFRNFFKEITASIVSKSADFNAHIICGKRVCRWRDDERWQERNLLAKRWIMSPSFHQCCAKIISLLRRKTVNYEQQVTLYFEKQNIYGASISERYKKIFKRDRRSLNKSV